MTGADIFTMNTLEWKPLGYLSVSELRKLQNSETLEMRQRKNKT